MNPPPLPLPTQLKNSTAPGTKRALIGALIALGLTLMVLFVIGVVKGHRRAAATQAAWQNVRDSGKAFSADIKNSFNPKTGITNVDLEQLDRARDQLKIVSENSSTDDARLAEAMSAHLGRMQVALKDYEAALGQLEAAGVLEHFDSSDKGQLAARREVVQRFLDANASLKRVLTNSEDNLRAELVKRQLPENKIERLVAGYHSSSAPLNTITIQIRQCDERIGGAMLDMLNTLESQRGHWKSDPVANKVIFADSAMRQAYDSSAAVINAAAEEQLKLQRQLVNLQRSQP